MYLIHTKYFLLGLLLAAQFSFAQSDTLNRLDDSNLKQGYWIIYGGDYPLKGFPENGIIEEGWYKDDKKHGFWIKYHKDGKTPRLKANYVNAQPNGDYIKYWPNGNVKEEGSKSPDKKPQGSLKNYYHDGTLSQQKFFNEKGQPDGEIIFYYEDGTVQYSMNKKNGVLVGTAKRFHRNGDVKQITIYNNDGTVKSKEDFNRVNPPKGEANISGSGGPSGEKGIIKDGSTFKYNGYNIVFNQNDELWLDGNFKGGKLWDGKVYKYDRDGLFLKIEIWKNGKYHSDGHLE